MRAKRCLIAVLVALGILLMSGPAPAGITKCYFQVFTTNWPGGGPPFQLNFVVIIEDSKLRPPEALTRFKIKGPDGTVYDYSADYWKYYVEWGNYFFFTITDPALIIEGTYKLTVRDKSVPRVTIVNTDKLTTITPLPTPNMIYPTATSPVTVVPLDATFSWEPVPGAQYYRIELFNESWKMPVFQKDKKPLCVYKNFYVVPKGVLMPNLNYSIQVEARDSDKKVMRRGRTFFIPFKAEP